LDPAIEQALPDNVSLESLTNSLASEPGFASLFHPLGRFYTAWPERSWTLPANAGLADQAIKDATDYYHRQLAEPQSSASPGGSPFRGGLAGILNYELGNLTVPGFESRQASREAGWIGAYHWALFVPHDGGQASLGIHPACPAPVRQKIRQWLQDGEQEPEPFAMTDSFRPTRSDQDYLAAVCRVLDYINAGDCYQVNLSRQLEGHYRGSPWFAWRALCEEIPVPYAAYLNTGSCCVMSVSPEQFLRIEGPAVSSKPIKGTRPRSSDALEDRRLKEELISHPKDRAENLMIVDLIRNDLSRFCEPGSVRVPEMFSIESYRNVHQLVSRVTGQLKSDVRPLEALLSAFPGGSITGAPKRRAMEIIDELEPHNRNAYCGSVFFLDQAGLLDSSISIRTLQAWPDGRIHCWGGGGIVADSSPQEELRETEFKVRRMMDILENL
jgi:para-aminobenzoate synthetase component 1